MANWGLLVLSPRGRCFKRPGEEIWSPGENPDVGASVSTQTCGRFIGLFP